MGRRRVVSIGYERRHPDELVEILLFHGVSKLLDVRELPMSRRKGFSKRALSERLSEAGIEYRHVREAGNPHRKEKHDILRCLKLYDGYLQANPSVLGNVSSQLGEGPVAFLCYERRHEHCHRSVLLARLREQDSEIEVVPVS